jgi:hypothetical protein
MSSVFGMKCGWCGYSFHTNSTYHTCKVGDTALSYKIKDPGDQPFGFYSSKELHTEWEDEDNHAGDPSLLNTVNVTLDDIKKQYTSVAVQSIGPGKVEVSAKEYLRVKTLLMDFIRDFKKKYPYEPLLSVELEQWYEQELEWEEVWKVQDIIKKLTREEYKLLEDHIRDQIEYEEESDNTNI